MGLEYPLALKSIDAFIAQAHGKPRGLSATEVSVLDYWAGQIVDAIADGWPEDGRDWWNHSLNTTKGTVGFMLEYAGDPEDPPLWKTLIPEVVRQHQTAMLAAMKAAILDTERRYQLYLKQGDKRAFNRAMSESSKGPETPL